MARVKIEMPHEFSFSTVIPVRITDINYGGHVGNDTVLTIMHEARMQFLLHHGFTEMNMAGPGMIMSDVAIQFINELFYGDHVTAYVTAGSFSKAAFDIYYRLEKNSGGKQQVVALAKTGMVCYDYDRKKIVAVPEEARKKLSVA